MVTVTMGVAMILGAIIFRREIPKWLMVVCIIVGIFALGAKAAGAENRDAGTATFIELLRHGYFSVSSADMSQDYLGIEVEDDGIFGDEETRMKWLTEAALAIYDHL